ncbi:hypothetical protein Atep_05530 [Allochromatium tepidum]|uniref:Uncharacterized protein n=1 Tax=Allochromatium tepidum TaxID=553982 RepID=A0ABN6G7E3_9GAMM|nr:hypothetical protein Atep_05530 [Allochromatium tepidum]
MKFLIKMAFGWIESVGGLAKTTLIGQANLNGQALLSLATYTCRRSHSQVPDKGWNWSLNLRIQVRR